MKEKLKNLFKRDNKETVELTKEELEFRDKFEKEFYYKTVLGIITTAVFLVIVFAIIFFINVEGKEDTKVPKLEGLKLHEAIIALQDKALYPKLSVKNSSPKDKGLIIYQDISAGSVVRAGRVINIISSLGGVIDKVGSYEGQTVSAVEAELQKLFASTSSDPVLVIGQPVEVVSDEPEGTILSQDPPAGTEITDITEIIFHVSKGKEQSSFVVPTMKGLTFEEGLNKITQWPIRFRFIVRNKRENEEAGVIVSQTPDRGISVPWTTVVEMTMTKPERYTAGLSFGLLEIVIPSSPVTVPMSLERVKNDGSREIVFTSRTFGGPTTIPYLEEIGNRLILTVNDVEIETFTVRVQ
ncbi:MAG: PASTA domain-containing protein [Spirochaetales bacterium]|nr:PASTA domain-containing protein [Spirochaetales bacterium]